MRAEGEQVAAASASGDAGRIVICVRVSLGAGSFENPGICCGLARLRVAEAPSTAVSGGVERKARALARHHALLVMRSDLKPYRAHHVQVTNAPGVAALPFAAEGCDGNGEIVAVHQADIVEILIITKGNLSKSGRRGPTNPITEEGPATITGGASAAALGVK